MRSLGDTTGSVWADPAQAYAESLLAPDVAASAVREALDVVESTGPGSSDADTVLAIVRHAVARRVPRPSPAQSRRLRGRSRATACAQMPELLAARAASMLAPADVDRLSVHLDTCVVCSALEERMAEADRAFLAAYTPQETPDVAGEETTTTPQPATWAGSGAARQLVPESPWIPGEIEVADPDDDITVTRGAPAVAASAWLIEPEVSDDAPELANVGSASEWLAVAPVPHRAEAEPLPQPEPATRPRRKLRAVIPVAALLAVAGAGLAISGVFDDDQPGRSASVTTAEPRTAPEAQERAPAAAQRRAERRVAARRRAERRAAARRRATARRRAAAERTAVRTPAISPPAPAGRPSPSPSPSPTPSPRREQPRRTTSNPTQTRPTAPSDAPRPSAPSSEPGRQIPTP